MTFTGAGYPICTLTYALVYAGLNDKSVANPISWLSDNARRTMYSYFTYVFSPAAQSRLTPAGYAPVPPGFLTKLRAGFQANF